MTSAASEEFDLVVRGGTALTADPARPQIDDAVIGIRDGRLAIVAAASAVGALSASRTIDASGLAITPGLINVRTPSILGMVRGVAEDSGFAPPYTPGPPHGHEVTPDEARALA